MKKCKNTECENQIEEKRIYCSLRCRNIYVNKNLRDYSKCAETQSGKKKYYENPKHCSNCDKIIEYEQRRNNFCSNSCSAQVSNKTRDKITYSKDALEKMKKIGIESAKQNFKNTWLAEDRREEYNNNLKHCLVCNVVLSYEHRRKIFCNKNCQKLHIRKNLTPKRLYKLDCRFKFNLADYKNEFDFDLIKEYGWYNPSNSKKPNLNGISRDHMYSIDEGFFKDVDPYLISHPANCKLIRQKDNSTKYKKSSITLDELKIRVENWNKKHKK